MDAAITSYHIFHCNTFNVNTRACMVCKADFILFHEFGDTIQPVCKLQVQKCKF